jgi:hypothetical protein
MMQAGPVEEIGHTTRTFIDALKDNPVTLLLSAANLMMVLFLYYALHAAAQFRTELISQSFDFQKTVTQTLASCVVQK